MTLIKFLMLAGSLFAGLFFGAPAPPPRHLESSLVVALALAFAAFVLVWLPRNRKRDDDA